ADGGQATPVVADLLDGDVGDVIVGHAKEAYGRVDILVNVAGGSAPFVSYRRTHEWNDADWDLIFGINLRYVFVVCRAAIAAMLEQGDGGSIVSVASINGLSSSPNVAAYGAAKAGLISLTKTLAL